ncbi:hypothetical protein D3C78_689170 [compost metagenome]
MLRGIVARAFWIVERKAVMNGNTNFVRIKVFSVNKPYIIGRDDRQTALFSKRDCRMQIVFFIGTTCANQLQIKTIREVFFIKRHALLNQNIVAAYQTFTDITHSTA